MIVIPALFYKDNMDSYASFSWKQVSTSRKYKRSKHTGMTREYVNYDLFDSEQRKPRATSDFKNWCNHASTVDSLNGIARGIVVTWWNICFKWTN